MKRDITKNSVKKLDAYIPEPQQAKIILNSNESPYNLPRDIRKEIAEALTELEYNRYPDPAANELRKIYSEKYLIPQEQILVGNGLDEVLSIIADAFIEPGDVVVTHKPGFAMYKVWSEIKGADVIEVEDTPEQKINIRGLVNEAIRNNAKIVFVCSPNNPTGQTINLQDLEELLESTSSLIVLDEAYADFNDESFIDLVRNYDNLMVLKTMSKAYRIPGARCGFVAGPVDLIETLYKVKAPYNLNALTQTIARIVMENEDDLEPGLEEIKNQRDDLFEFLDSVPEIDVLPSAANFFYLKTPRHKELQDAFLENDVLVRYFPKDEAFRITIGTPKENKEVMRIIKEVFDA